MNLKTDLFSDKNFISFCIVSTVLIFGVTIFVFWWNVTQVEKDVKQAINVELTSYDTFKYLHKDVNDTINIKQRILVELDIELHWEWAHEKYNRSISQGMGYLVLFIHCALLFVVMSFALPTEIEQEGYVKISHTKLNLLMFLAALNIGIPAYIDKQKYDLKQQAHDLRSRDLLMIRIELETNKLTNEQAWAAFRAVYKAGSSSYAIKAFDKR